MAVQPWIVEGYDFDSLMKRVGHFADLLLEHGLLAFREVHLTRPEHGTFFRALGAVHNHFRPLGGVPTGQPPEAEPDFVGLTKADDDYSWRGETSTFLAESHGQAFKAFADGEAPWGDWDNSKDGRSNINTVLPWHIECPMNEWPQIASAWTMPWKICPPEQGATGFCDYQDLYDILDGDLQEFLRTEPAYINDVRYSSEHTHLDGYPVSPGYNGEFIRPVALPHPVTGKYSIRHSPCLATGFISEGLDEQMLRFKEAVREYTNNNHYFWEWTIGDLLIVDLWRMAHTVSDFPLGERTMVGTWGYGIDAPDHP